MADGPTEPDSDDGGRPEEGRILSPEELDISKSEHVEQIDDDRYVVSSSARAGGVPTGNSAGNSSQSTPTPDQRSDAEPDRASESPERPAAAESESEQVSDTRTSREVTDETVHEWLRRSFESNPSRYGFDVTATFDGSVSQRRMASNDVVTIFESLVLWYAQQVDSNTPVEEVLGILLMEANVPVRYPTESLHSLVKSAGLGPDDTIADLLAAVDEDDGIKL